MKYILQILQDVGNLVQVTNLLVFFQADEDPELIEIIVDEICKHLKRFSVDQILIMLANMRHTLSPSVLNLYGVVNSEFVERMHDGYTTKDSNNYVKPEDTVKILNVLLDHQQMKEELKNGMLGFIEDNMTSFTFETLAELAVIHAAKQDKTYRNLFFEKVRDRFVKELQYLKDETAYKILWAMFKADQLTA